MIWLLHDKVKYQKNVEFTLLFLRHPDVRLIFVEDLEIFDGELYYERIKMEFPRGVVFRTEAPLYAMFFEKHNIRCFNNKVIQLLGNNKYICHKYMKTRGIPVMKTWMLKDVSRLNYPSILKTIDGHGGNETYIVDNKEQYRNIVDKHGISKLLVQEIASEVGRDLRVYVLGNKIAKILLRKSSSDFRCNFIYATEVEEYQPSDQEMAVINKVISYLQIDFAGIDFIFDYGQIVFNDLVDVVGSRILYKITDCDLVKEYYSYLVKELYEEEKND